LNQQFQNDEKNASFKIACLSFVSNIYINKVIATRAFQGKLSQSHVCPRTTTITLQRRGAKVPLQITAMSILVKESIDTSQSHIGKYEPLW